MPPANALDREREGAALARDLAEERRASSTRELHAEVFADEGGVARNHDRLEITRARLQQSAAARGLLDQNFAPLAQQAQIALPCPGANRSDESGQPLTRDLVRHAFGRGEAGRRRPFARRKFESVRVVESNR